MSEDGLEPNSLDRLHALVRPALDGDRRAQRELVPHLRRWAHARVAMGLWGLADADVDDVTSHVVDELFVPPPGALHSFNPTLGNLRTYVRVIAARRVIDRLRRRARSREDSLDDADGGGIDQLPGVLPGQGRREEARQMLVMVVDELRASLSDGMFETFRLRYIEGRSPSEIMAIQDLTRAAVDQRARQLRLRIEEARASIDARLREEVES